MKTVTRATDRLLVITAVVEVATAVVTMIAVAALAEAVVGEMTKHHEFISHV